MRAYFLPSPPSTCSSRVAQRWHELYFPRAGFIFPFDWLVRRKTILTWTISDQVMGFFSEGRKFDSFVHPHLCLLCLYQLPLFSSLIKCIHSLLMHTKYLLILPQSLIFPSKKQFNFEFLLSNSILVMILVMPFWYRITGFIKSFNLIYRSNSGQNDKCLASSPRFSSSHTQ